MANEWLRLWHDMPNDPKWRTIARVSGEPIALVQAVYLHLLVDASRNVTRGHVTVTKEDLSSALDVTEDQISNVLNAMEARVIDNGYLTGWERRQPKKEDVGNPETGAKSAAQRKREQRERERQARENPAQSQSVTDCHDESRTVTTDKDKDTDTDTDKDKYPPNPPRRCNGRIPFRDIPFEEIMPDPKIIEVDLRRAGLPPPEPSRIEQIHAEYCLMLNDEEAQTPAEWRKRFRRQILRKLQQPNGNRLTSLTPPEHSNGQNARRPERHQKLSICEEAERRARIFEEKHATI